MGRSRPSARFPICDLVPATKLEFLWNSCYQTSAAVRMRPALFWGLTQHRLVIPYRRFGTTCLSHLKGSKSLLSRNFGVELILTQRKIPEERSSCFMKSVYRCFNKRFLAHVNFMKTGSLTTILYVRAWMNLFSTFHVSGPIWENFGMGDHQIMSKITYDFHVKPFHENHTLRKDMHETFPILLHFFSIWYLFGRSSLMQIM